MQHNIVEHYWKIFLLNAFINPITEYKMFHRCVGRNKKIIITKNS